ncbi:hypothetical protein GWK16_03015 [Roseomonas sp. JC162]|uniref:AsmA-like C-terminal domain-containing protein n=1 Tax=Neoroseomonas marina TaxID=1232220 RepID=A0A848E9F6_9PROT|nr:AsmA family protein [Neoroseomonas marina]NMJ40197.1 hypothetical protein [Neoroseomonas marina]
MSRRSKIILGILVGLPVLAVLAAILVVPRIELGPAVAARATAALGREVTVASLRVSPGLTTALALRGARLSNIEGGTRPTMAEVASLDATIDLLPLLRGQVVLRDATADGFVLYLERAPGRRANWRFGERPPPAAAAPQDRSGFPMFHAVRMTRSEVVFRTTSGNELRTALDEVTLTSPAVDQPTALRAAGSYNAVPLRLDGVLGSVAALRDAATPFPMTLNATADATELRFNGTSTDPLNFDGMDGRLALTASSPRAILAMAGAEGGPAVPIEVAGRFTRQGDVWRLLDGEGKLDGGDFTAPRLELTEGNAGQPDAVVARMAFARLDLGRLLGDQGGGEGDADTPLAVPARPDPLVRAEITARQFVHPDISGTEASVKVDVAPSRIGLETHFVTSFGARLSAAGEAVPAGDGARLAADIELRDADIDGLRRAFGVHSVPVAGRMSVDAALTLEAATLAAARRNARLSAVASIVDGSISREVIEMASTDVRALFRTSQGMTRVTCLLAAVDVNGGRGEAAPLRIRAGTGTIAGLATFDLNRKRLDLIIGSERASTDFFALDIPVRVSGSFSDPSIEPARWSREGRARLERGGMAPLPPNLMEIARRNPCYAGRSFRR